MKLLIATPTLGESPWLPETVASVEACAPGAMHALVCPAAQVESLRARFPRCMVFPEPLPPLGMYAAINRALIQVNEWDAFSYLNDDDLLRPEFANAAAIALTATNAKAAALVYGGVALVGPRGHRIGRIPVSEFPSQNRSLYAERLEPVYQHGSIVTRAAWEKVGGFDESFRYCGDSEYLARLCTAGVPAYRARGVMAAFRLHSGQLTKRRSEMIAERERVDQKLGLLADVSPLRRLFARSCFRIANFPIYAERIARHGFVSFDELLERTK